MALGTWVCAYGEPSDMLTTSTASEMSPSPFGSRAKSMPCNSAAPLHAVDTELQTLDTYRVASVATPLLPAMIEETWVPCPPAHGAGIAAGPQSIGSGSGATEPIGHASPTKSNPPATFAVGNKPSLVALRGSVTEAP